MKQASAYATKGDPDVHRQFSRCSPEAADSGDPPTVPLPKNLDDLSAELATAGSSAGPNMQIAACRPSHIKRHRATKAEVERHQDSLFGILADMTQMKALWVDAYVEEWLEKDAT